MLAGGFAVFVALTAFGVPIVLAIAIGGACSIVAGLAIDTIVYQPLHFSVRLIRRGPPTFDLLHRLLHI